MDNALEALIDDSEDDYHLDLSPEGIEREKRRWVLYDDASIDIFVLWSNMSGMGGESLVDILSLAQMPGSAALIKDFATLSSRKSTLEKRTAWHKK